MLLEKYCKDTDLLIIQFTIELTKDIHAKISARALFYEEQVIRYAEKRIRSFLHPLSLKHTLKFVYQSEILQTILFKLKPTFEQQHVLRCISS
ncbi:hypothetical protein [Priestia megaterium]|uniref:Uncharacterized protein n=1 Tax=Priestia megaterium TaxID=1404 RepID=A0A6M6DTD2_PRIMG|nr:hypothetical protein [Priestia megaterium]MCJ7988587.1 hypothetical protein [Priestia sp. OVS21]QJX77852.1 hypothetical protein FDZ14_17255 [Priestia megaterium]